MRREDGSDGVTDSDNLIVGRGRTLMEQPVDDEMFGLEPQEGNFYGFNASAARIWALIEQPRPFAALCATLAEEFDVAPETCRVETLAMLRDLEADGLVTLTPAT